jgi:hypothetical protein
MRSSTLLLLATLLCIGCADVQRSLDSNPKLVILNDKESHIACDGGVLITQENQGKYAVRFRELNGGSIGVTDVHGVERVETRDLNDNVRDNFGLHLTGDKKQDALLHTCVGDVLTTNSGSNSLTPPDVAPVGLPSNPYKANSPCWQWYNEHPRDNKGCKDDQNPQ